MQKNNVLLFYLIVFFIPLLFNPFGADLFEIPKQSFLISIIGIGIAAISVSIFRRKKIQFYFHPLVMIGITLWLISLAVSGMTGKSPLESFWGGDRMQGVFTTVIVTVHFFFCLHIFQKKQYQRLFFQLILGIGAIISIYAILQFFRIDPFPFADINEASGRSYSTLGHPNLLGQWLIIPIVIALITLYYERKKILFLPIVLFLAALFMSFNRASILGLTISLGIFLISKLKWNFWKKISAIISVLIVLALLFIGFTGTRSIGSRTTLIRASVPLIIENPFFGTGSETFYQTYQTIGLKDLTLTERMFDIPDRVHNEILQVLLDQGFFGLILYAGGISTMIWLFFKKKNKNPVLQIAFHTLLASLISVQFGFSQIAQTVTLSGMLAIFLLELLRFKKFVISVKNIAVRLFIFSFGLFLFIGLEYRAFAITMADMEFQKGIETSLLYPEKSLVAFKNAVTLNPFYRSYPYHAIAFLSVQEVITKNITTNLLNFVERLRQITNSGYHADLATALIAEALKKPEAAEQFFREAIEKAPVWPYIWMLFGDFEFERGNFPAAVEKYKQLLSLAPPYWKWECDQKEHSFEELEKLRIFKKGHPLFYEAMKNLLKSYENIHDAKPDTAKIRYCLR